MKRILGSLVALALLAGCAAGGAVQQTSATSVAVDSTKTGGVVVKSSVKDRESVVEGLRQAINNQLLNKRVFASLPGDVTVADIRLDVTIIEVSEVSQASRILFAALAGQAKIVADVDVIDARTNQSLGQMRAEGKSSGGHVFAGTTSEALDQMASQVADYLLRNRKI